MTKENSKYLKVIFLHSLLGYLLYLFKPMAILYIYGVLVYFVFLIIIRDNKNNEALQAAASVAGNSYRGGEMQGSGWEFWFVGSSKQS